MRILFVVALVLIQIDYAYAAVTIHEIAWMGTSASANDEWIELYNSGSGSVSLDGWRITDSNNFDVTLTGAGTIAAGAYAVLERTDDGSAPGTAFYIYTGSLPNTGATLRLYDAASNLVDQVAGGEDWKTIGGDNTTKHTAQYTTSGWITAAPTPGTTNATKAEETTVTTQSQSSGSSGSGISARRTTAAVDATETDVLINAPDIAFVSQPIPFKADWSGQGAHSKTGKHTVWNFGDTHTAVGSEVIQQYLYPGTYIVTARNTHKDEIIAARHEITVLPVQLDITRNRSGAVQISNDSPAEIELSDFTVVAGADQYTFPAGTLVKEQSTITIPPQTLTVGSDAVVAVYDQRETVVAYQIPTRKPNMLATRTESTPSVTPIPSIVQANPQPTSFSFTTEETVPYTTTTVVESITATSNLVGLRTEEPIVPTTNRTAYILLVGVLSVAILALLAPRKSLAA